MSLLVAAAAQKKKKTTVCVCFETNSFSDDYEKTRLVNAKFFGAAYDPLTSNKPLKVQ